MDFTRYYQARDMIERIISDDLLGPVFENEIVCDERPLDYYLLGKLYPQGAGYDDNLRSTAEDCGELDEEMGVSLSNSGNPASFGLSFSINSGIEAFEIKSSAAQYELITEEDAKTQLGFKDGAYKKNAHFWQRHSLVFSPIIVSVSNLTVGKVKHISMTILT